MEIAALLLFLLFLLTGAAGIILPVLPGVPLVAVGAVLAAWMTGFAGLGWAPLLWVIALAVLSQVLEYVAGLIGARYYGARRAGLWGSILGSIVGVIWLPPLGLLIGALGGMVASGLIGLFLGAILLAFAYQIFWDWVDEAQLPTAAETMQVVSTNEMTPGQ